ncbi:MAG: hypothetical protein R3E31_09370 [Chloroflexota bacterium]
MKRLLLLLSLLVFSVVGCNRNNGGTSTEAVPAVVPTFSTRELPVTFTPAPTVIADTPTPVATTTAPAPTATPINFDETAVELRYFIPALNLQRRLQGNVASQIIFVDETTGAALQRSNQASVLLELQQVLPQLTLETLPEGCDTCVYIEYMMPLSGESGAGWLQDPVLLVSIENIMAAVLGPHFPTGTVVGLRRSASPYAPAHTIAITAGGTVWQWLATDAQIDAPLAEGTAVPNLAAILSQLPLDTLSSEYTTSCPGVPVETLYLNQGGSATEIQIACPEFTLPTTLLPLYLALNNALQPKLAQIEGPARPPAGFPLDALLDYRRQDGAQLTVYYDGLTVARDAVNNVYTSTLTSAEIISVTTPLLTSGVVQPGLATFFTTEESDSGAAASRLLVRSVDGVYDARWTGTETAVADLDTLLNTLIATDITPPPTPEATPETTETPIAAPTP